MQNLARWRIALVASALVVLGAVGAGLVSAADPAAAPPDSTGGAPAANLLGGPFGGSFGAPNDERRGRHGGRFLAHLQRVIHLEATVDVPDKGIVTFAVDHGTVTAIGGGTIGVKEKDGRTVTLKTTDATKVRKAREPADLGDLKVGDEVVVMSRLDDGSFVAYRIGVPPAPPASTN